MINFVLRVLVSGLAVFLTAKIVNGFKIDSYGSAVIAALVIGVLNAVLWPLLMLLTLPINIVTLGLFTFVVNAAVLKASAALLPGFSIDSWWAAIIGSIVLSIVSVVLHYVFV